MADIDPSSNTSPRVSPTKARQGDRSKLNVRVLIFSMAILVTIIVVYFLAAWAWPARPA